MFDIVTIAGAIAVAREHCLPGKESVAVGEVLWCARGRLLLYPRSSPMPRLKNVVALPEFRPLDLEVETSLLVGLRKEAIARGTNAPRLVRALLGAIIADHLVDAVLDDQTAAD
jgi:hypothetical protein